MRGSGANSIDELYVTLMVYLPFIVTIAQRYRKSAGLGTVVALMLPYTLVIAVVWILFFILWFVLGIPLGLRFILAALASGFLITTVVQGIIPEANREGEPGFAGLLYIGGLSLYALMSLLLH